MAATLGLTTIYILLPLGIVVFSDISGIIKKVRPIIFCYLIGAIIGNSGLLPENSFNTLDLLSTATVALSIPLMLFSVDLRKWKELTGKAGLAMGCAFVAILFASAFGYIIFGRGMAEGWKISGLLVGVYTGGTPNMAAIQKALQVDPDIYLAVHTSDVVVGAAYLFVLLSFGKILFRKILPPYKPVNSEQADVDSLSVETLLAMMGRGKRLPLMAAFGLTLLVVAIGGGVSMVMPGEAGTVVAILSITTLSLALSFIHRVRNVRYSFQLGEYIILIFCTVVGSMADVRKLAASIPAVFLYVTFAVMVSILVHVLLCRLLRIDADTMMITSTSAIYSPPFVTAVASAIGNKEIVVAGITTGIIGYAAGNYLGVLLAKLLQVVG